MVATLGFAGIINIYWIFLFWRGSVPMCSNQFHILRILWNLAGNVDFCGGAFRRRWIEDFWGYLDLVKLANHWRLCGFLSIIRGDYRFQKMLPEVTFSDTYIHHRRCKRKRRMPWDWTWDGGTRWLSLWNRYPNYRMQADATWLGSQSSLFVPSSDPAKEVVSVPALGKKP